VAGSALLANQLVRTDPWLLGGRQRARLSIVTPVGGECNFLNPDHRQFSSIPISLTLAVCGHPASIQPSPQQISRKKMPTVEPPRQQQPMEAATSASSSQGELVTQQPVGGVASSARVVERLKLTHVPMTEEERASPAT